jgi:hypothetical protein
MTTQYRSPEAARAGLPMYAPVRDILHLMPEVLAKVPMQLYQHHCPHTLKLCQDNGVTDEHLKQAFEAYANLIEQSHTEEYGPKVYDAINASGWAACHPVARIAVLSCMGQTLTYTLWKFIREFSRLGGESTAKLDQLMAWTEEAARYANMKPWQKWVYRFLRFFRSVTLVTKKSDVPW